MSQKLEQLINVFVDNKYSEITKEMNEGEEKEYLIDGVKEKIRSEIIGEIKEEYKEEIVEQAEKEIEQQERKKRITEIKEVIWSGFFVALFVGLLVNQITDIISFYKGASSIKDIAPTYIICLVFMLICLAIFLWQFMNKIMDFLNEINK